MFLINLFYGEKMEKKLKKIGLYLGFFAAAFLGYADDHITVSPKNHKLIEQSQHATIYSLITDRLILSEQLAKAHWNEKTPIDDIKKEEAFLVDVEKKAASSGLDRTEITNFFNAQLDASKMICIENFEIWVKNDLHKHKNAAESSKIEAQIEKIDNQILDLIKASEGNLLKDKKPLKDALAKDLQIKGFSRDVIDSATQF